MNEKAKYVKSQKQTRSHHCHWPDCKKQVPPAMWGCYKHWMMLPTKIRRTIFRVFRPGQEKDFNPSEEYLRVAEATQKWIKSNYLPNDIKRETPK